MNKEHKLKDISKYLLLTIGGIILFLIGSRQALHDRGYYAIGGEIFLLAIPLIYKGVEDMIQDLKSQINDYRNDRDA